MANINGLTGTAADVNSSNQLKVTLPTDPTTATASSVRIFSENDPGTSPGRLTARARRRATTTDCASV